MVLNQRAFGLKGRLLPLDVYKRQALYHDLDQYIYKLTAGNSDYDAWKAAFDKVMVYWKSTPRNYSAYVLSLIHIFSACTSRQAPKPYNWDDDLHQRLLADFCLTESQVKDLSLIHI